MLLWITKISQLSFFSLMRVYEEGNMEKAAELSPENPSEVLIEIEQEFYQYLKECFFQLENAVYAVWVDQGEYVSALRLEPYQDGWLISALETAPGHRRKGYAAKLLSESLRRIKGTVYSHVHKRNLPSSKLHTAIGFQKMMDYAVYLDGSVNSACNTLVYYVQNDCEE